MAKEAQPDAIIRADHFQQKADRDPTPANNGGHVPALEDDGFLHGDFVRQPVVKTYTSSDTWTKPANLKYIVVRVQAPGGNGGNGSGSDTGASGGGSGGYSEKLYSAEDLDATESPTIGATTSFKDVSCTAGGNASGLTPGTAGNASGGDLNIPGRAGETGQSGAGQEVGAAGADSMLGIGGGATQSGNGMSAVGYGAGGGGAAQTGGGGASGGSGAPGYITLTEYFI